ncbi:MAG: diguanylate cyclase [Bryobacteraceae bacterium]
MIYQPSPAQTEASESPTAWRALCTTLLDRLVREAVVLESQHREFLVQTTKGELSVASSSEFVKEQLAAAQRVAAMVFNHNRETQTTLDRITAELAGVLQSLGSLSEYSNAGETESLEALSRMLGETDQAVDLVVIRERLLASVEALKNQLDEKKKQQAELINNLQNRAAILEKMVEIPMRAAESVIKDGGSSVNGATDPATGLPDRGHAEDALRQVASGGNSDIRKWAAVVCLPGLNVINVKYGRVIGNSILLLISQHLAELVAGPSDGLFRWSGPAFVGVLERFDSVQNVKREVRNFVGTFVGRHFDWPDRSLYLPIRLRAEVFDLRSRVFAEVCNEIDSFILAASQENR